MLDRVSHPCNGRIGHLTVERARTSQELAVVQVAKANTFYRNRKRQTSQRIRCVLA